MGQESVKPEAWGPSVCQALPVCLSRLQAHEAAPTWHMVNTWLISKETLLC